VRATPADPSEVAARWAATSVPARNKTRQPLEGRQDPLLNQKIPAVNRFTNFFEICLQLRGLIPAYKLRRPLDSVTYAVIKKSLLCSGVYAKIHFLEERRKMKDYLKLLKFMRPYLGKFGLASVCMAYSAVFDGVSLAMMVPLADKVLTNKQIIVPVKLPGILASLVDKINSFSPEALLNYMAIAIISLFILKGFFGFMQS